MRLNIEQNLLFYIFAILEAIAVLIYRFSNFSYNLEFLLFMTLLFFGYSIYKYILPYTAISYAKPADIF